MNLNMPTGILREVPRDDASARLTRPAPDVDIPAAEDAVRSLLVALGQDPEAEHLRQTPRRVAAAYSELLTADDFELQERLTKQIADCLDSRLQPKGVGVVPEAEHLCMSLRGVRARGSRTLTSELSGHLRHDAAVGQEFYSLTRGR